MQPLVITAQYCGAVHSLTAPPTPRAPTLIHAGVVAPVGKIVNESALTGESTPMLKMPLTRLLQRVKTGEVQVEAMCHLRPMWRRAPVVFEAQGSSCLAEPILQHRRIATCGYPRPEAVLYVPRTGFYFRPGNSFAPSCS